MLAWYIALGYGAIGGLIAEAIPFLQRVRNWQQARRASMSEGRVAPKLFTSYVDPLPDFVVALTAAFFGCVAAWVLRSQLSGVYAAVAVGASAQEILSSLSRGSYMAPKAPLELHEAPNRVQADE